jgi:hypothetical protein
MAAARPHRPAEDWLAILSRPTLEAFAEAFVAMPTLEASVLATPIRDARGIRAFFHATRAMYDVIAFTAEHRWDVWTCLEWEGLYRGRPIAGATLLITDANGAIERIRLFHTPLDQVVAFAADLSRRLDPADRGLTSRSGSANSEPTSCQEDRQ